MKRVIVILGFLLGSSLLLQARTWTEEKTGRTVEGGFRKLNAGQVEILRSNGTLLRLPLARLSEADKKFVAEKGQAMLDAEKAAKAPKVTHQKGRELKEGDVIDLSFRSINAGKVNLVEMKGKVVMLDFWATWCGPCIEELPTVKKVYEKYHDKGFEIIGISLDSDKGSLKRFIKDNDMPWPQYFDGNGWKNKLAQQYGVRSIPSVVLVKDNKVVATGARGERLEYYLKKLLR